MHCVKFALLLIIHIKEKQDLQKIINLPLKLTSSFINKMWMCLQLTSTICPFVLFQIVAVVCLIFVKSLNQRRWCTWSFKLIYFIDLDLSWLENKTDILNRQFRNNIIVVPGRAGSGERGGVIGGLMICSLFQLMSSSLMTS